MNTRKPSPGAGQLALLVVDGWRPGVPWVAALPKVEWFPQDGSDRDALLSSREVQVLTMLACDAYGITPEKVIAAPGAENLSKWTGIPKRSVYRVVDRLARWVGDRPPLLEVEASKGRKRTRYRLRIEVYSVHGAFDEPHPQPVQAEHDTAPVANSARLSTGTPPTGAVAAQDRTGSDPSYVPPTVRQPVQSRAQGASRPIALQPSITSRDERTDAPASDRSTQDPDVIDQFREGLNNQLPARLRLNKSANARLAGAASTGHTPERVHRWLDVVVSIPGCHTGGPILDMLDGYADEVAKSNAGPESRNVNDPLPPRCEPHQEPAHACIKCRYPTGEYPRDPAIPDRAPVFIPETRAERVARKHAEAEARDEAERAERAARRKAREAALADDTILGPERPATRRPPTEAEVIALAEEQAAEQARWADQADDTEQESESA